VAVAAVAQVKWVVYLQLTDAEVLAVMAFNLLLQEQILIMLVVVLVVTPLQVGHLDLQV
jgi:hypothetical protein